MEQIEAPTWEEINERTQPLTKEQLKEFAELLS
jgi:hypothetical protein